MFFLKFYKNYQFLIPRFSFVNILSPCPTCNKIDTFQYYKGRTIDINKDLGHDSSDYTKAVELASHALDHDNDPNAKVPLGIFLKIEKPTFEDKVLALKEKYCASDNPDWDKILERYRP